MENNYYENLDTKNIVYLRKLLQELPPFLKEFFKGISTNCSSNTRLNYAYDLRIFFNYILEHEEEFKNIKILDFTLSDLDKINIDHIENFIDYISYYKKETENGTKYYKNKESGKARKLSSLRKMFLYYYKKRKISKNPSELINPPRSKEKNITRLDMEEVYKLLEEIENGKNLTKKQQHFHSYTKTRDLAIITLLLGTGIRLSECVGIDIKNIDFKNSGIKIIRKGGNETIIYFGSEVQEALINYLNEREHIIPESGHENAFFLSLQNKRLTSRAIQNLVKKYSTLVTKLKNISPHKLRSTYGTNLYKETGDIYLVASVLGHKDVNTTRKHYAHMDENRKKSAANIVKLRNKK